MGAGFSGTCGKRRGISGLRHETSLSIASPPQQCPATGQTTSFTAGDDGDIEAGATLSYTDNGDGTITDNNTKLMWEKKSDDDSIHDKDTLYTWANAFAVHIAALNNTCDGLGSTACTTSADCGVGEMCGFAGHRDWRLPNVKELQSIVNYENVNPAVSSAFNTCSAGCGVTSLTCSCTAPQVPGPTYWSSSTLAGIPTDAWFVNFFNGAVNGARKTNTLFVRAVRGGL